MSDAIDVAAGLLPGDVLFEKRRFRPEFVHGAELCRRSVLKPADDLGLAPGLRVALACRIARLNADRAITSAYEQQLAEFAPSKEILALARGSTDFDGKLATISRHVDLVTLTPIQARASDIVRLVDGGLSSPQIVALSELIAFGDFQTRVATGFRLMRSV